MSFADLPWLPQPPHWAIDWPLVDAACPWLAELAQTPQDPIHHAEGDVLTHTRLVAEALAGLAGWRVLAPDARAALFLAALLHDTGKPETTAVAADGRISAPGHAAASAAITRRLLSVGGWPTMQNAKCKMQDASCKLPHAGADAAGAALSPQPSSAPLAGDGGRPPDAEAGAIWRPSLAERERLVALVRLHGLPLWFIERADLRRAILPASLRARLSEVALLAEADALGRVCADQGELLDRLGLFRGWCAEQGCLDGPYPFPSDHSRVRYCRRIQQDPDHHAFDDTWGEVLLLSGLPGAGKDTWLRSSRPELPVVALDAIRAALGVDPAAPQGRVVQEAKAQARALLRKRQPFAWNATNLTRQLRDPLIDLIMGYGARVRVVYLDTPPATALERNGRRADPVPEAVIRRLAARAEPPDLTEAHAVEVG